MTRNETSCRTTRRSRRVAQAAATLCLASGLLFAGGPPAIAESDSLSNQCIYMPAGVKRACAYYLSVDWGSGIYWQAGGQLIDDKGDYWDNTVEIKLDRKWSSNTGWIQVLRAGDWQMHSQYISGHDPTNGAWVRLCTLSPSGAKYCKPSRYVTDNS